MFDVLCAYVGLVLALLCNISQNTQKFCVERFKSRMTDHDVAAAMWLLAEFGVPSSPQRVCLPAPDLWVILA